MEVTNINQLDLVNGLYTYADYFLWKIEERIELLKGKIFKMSPAPAIPHQRWYFLMQKAKKIVLYSPTCVWYATLRN